MYVRIYLFNIWEDALNCLRKNQRKEEGGISVVIWKWSQLNGKEE